MIFQAQSAEPTHPADTLGIALTRANGVLQALTACHDPANGSFALGDQFVLQAVAAIEGFVGDARTAYLDMCNRCDLRLQEPDPAAATTTATPPSEDATVLPPLPQAKLTPATQSEGAVPREEFSPSYDDLLRKLTAAEVFASEYDGNGRSDGSPTILPLLKSLRQDLERYKAA